MNKELQDHVWKHCLPKEFKEEVKKMYNGHILNDLDYGCNSALINLFGENLTSDADGEDELLTVPRKDIVELYREVQKTISQCKGTELATQAIGIRSVIWSFFGSKCLPDKKIGSKRLVNIIKDSMENPLPDKMLLDGTIEPKTAEPKYHKGEKVCYNGYVYEVEGLVGKNRYAIKGLNFDLDEDMIEPYTEPEKNIAENRNLSQDRDKQFYNILKNSIAKERRLAIAAQMMQGLICAPLVPGIDPNPPAEYLAQTAFRLADALIAEAEKEDCYSSELTDKLNGK